MAYSNQETCRSATGTTPSTTARTDMLSPAKKPMYAVDDDHASLNSALQEIDRLTGELRGRLSTVLVASQRPQEHAVQKDAAPTPSVCEEREKFRSHSAYANTLCATLTRLISDIDI